MLYNLFENRDFVSVFAVALLAEGVDRNDLPLAFFQGFDRSPSSRRAWIEIKQDFRAVVEKDVALLAEGVDRNDVGLCVLEASVKSPSSRRAWIEISCYDVARCRDVSPSSRRAWIEMFGVL